LTGKSHEFLYRFSFAQSYALRLTSANRSDSVFLDLIFFQLCKLKNQIGVFPSKAVFQYQQIGRCGHLSCCASKVKHFSRESERSVTILRMKSKSRAINYGVLVVL
jgi:hypothetical protein